MKRFLLIILLLSANSVFPGVGGSVGGSSNRELGFAYYLKSRQHSFEIPAIEFKVEGSSITLPINEVCQRDEDILESKKELKVSHFDDNGNLISETMEKVSRSRKYIKSEIKRHWFREHEVIKVEALIPVDYDIEIYSSHSRKDKDQQVVKILKYSLESCK